MTKLISRKIYTKNGDLLAVLITNADISTKDYNRLFRDGMICTITNEKSNLVNKNLVD